MVFSYGPNASGAWTVDGAQLAAPVGTALNELENLDANDVIFVDAEYSEDDVTPFDDLIRGYTEAQLIQPLVDVGLNADRMSIAQAQLRRIRDAVVVYAVATPILAPGVDPDATPISFVFGTPGCNCSLPPDNDPGTCGGATPGWECASCVGPAPIPGCQQSIFRAVPRPVAGGVNTAALGLPASDQLDPWGTAIIYTVTPLNLGWDLGDPAPVGGDGVWSGNIGPANGITLQSLGPNGLNDGCVPGLGVDDICLALSVQELLALITASGHPVD